MSCCYLAHLHCFFYTVSIACIGVTAIYYYCLRFTVGKVSVSGKSGSDLVRKGAASDYISPMVLVYLEQSGLMNPTVPVAPAEPLGVWF